MGSWEERTEKHDSNKIQMIGKNRKVFGGRRGTKDTMYNVLKSQHEARYFVC